MKQTLALDMDNTITKLSPAFLQYVEFNMNITAIEWETFECNHYKYYELEKYFPCPSLLDKISPDEMYNTIFNDYDFWIDLPIMDKAVENIEILNKKYNLYIVTYPYHNLRNCIQGKLNWIQKNLPFIRYHQIVFNDKRGELPYDIIIDDNPDILKNANEQNLTTIKFPHGYNKNRVTDYSLNNGWFGVYNIL